MNAYLPADAMALLITLGKMFPISSLTALVLGYGAIYGLLKARFKRGGGDILFFAGVVSVIFLFTGACVYLLLTRSGYRV